MLELSVLSDATLRSWARQEEKDGGGFLRESICWLIHHWGASFTQNLSLGLGLIPGLPAFLEQAGQGQGLGKHSILHTLAPVDA